MATPCAPEQVTWCCVYAHGSARGKRHGEAVPVRFPTAQNQRLYNGKNLPAGATDADWINTPMWWNK